MFQFVNIWIEALNRCNEVDFQFSLFLQIRKLLPLLLVKSCCKPFLYQGKIWNPSDFIRLTSSEHRQLTKSKALIFQMRWFVVRGIGFLLGALTFIKVINFLLSQLIVENIRDKRKISSCVEILLEIKTTYQKMLHMRVRVSLSDWALQS